jgi:ATP-binding cassette subfamily B protein
VDPQALGYDTQQGAIRIGLPGQTVDVRRLRLASLRRAVGSLRRAVGMVFEEAFLFSDTVRANIAYGCPDATDEDVRRAARTPSAHEFISALPQGYGTRVGERGLTLSGGATTADRTSQSAVLGPARAGARQHHLRR